MHVHQQQTSGNDTDKTKRTEYFCGFSFDEIVCWFFFFSQHTYEVSSKIPRG